MAQSEGGNVAVHLAEQSHQKGQPFLMPQTERALVAHGILSRFLKAFINRVSQPPLCFLTSVSSTPSHSLLRFVRSYSKQYKKTLLFRRAFYL